MDAYLRLGEAETDIAEMVAQAEAVNRRAAAVFEELEALRAQAPA